MTNQEIQWISFGSTTASRLGMSIATPERLNSPMDQQLDDFPLSFQMVEVSLEDPETSSGTKPN